MNNHDTADFLQQSNFHLFLSHIAAGSSFSSLLYATFTKSNIGWAVGIAAACFSMYASYLSAKEKRLSIEKMNREKHIKHK